MIKNMGLVEEFESGEKFLFGHVFDPDIAL